jgi:hypothetical protein
MQLENGDLRLVDLFRNRHKVGANLSTAAFWPHPTLPNLPVQKWQIVLIAAHRKNPGLNSRMFIKLPQL